MKKFIGKGEHRVKVGNHPHTKVVGTLKDKCGILEMHLKLRDQLLKTTLYIHRLLYQNLMVTTNQKSTIDTYTRKKKKQSKHNNSHQITKENKRGREEKRPTKTNPKQLTKWQ